MVYRTNPPVTDQDLNALFASAWPDYQPSAFAQVLDRSLTYVCAYDGEQLVGFVNVAWDGGNHAFILDTTVHGQYQRRGIGQTLVEHAATVAKETGIDWLHVDYEPHLSSFYAACGFRPTAAGLRNLKREE